MTTQKSDEDQDLQLLTGVNPKDLIGIKKPQLGLLPAAGKIYGALAMEYGAYRAGKDGKGYGPYNWRSKSVLYSIYLDAIERHVYSLRDGEDVAPDSLVHHLGHIIACGCLLADALEGGYLKDDRPTKGPASETIKRFTKE